MDQTGCYQLHAFWLQGWVITPGCPSIGYVEHTGGVVDCTVLLDCKIAKSRGEKCQPLPLRDVIRPPQLHDALLPVALLADQLVDFVVQVAQAVRGVGAALSTVSSCVKTHPIDHSLVNQSTRE